MLISPIFSCSLTQKFKADYIGNCRETMYILMLGIKYMISMQEICIYRRRKR